MFQSYLEEVPNIEITKLEMNLEKDTINKNESMNVNVTVTPNEAKDNKLIYKSSNTSVAIIDDKGEILGVSSGICDITVSSSNGKVSDTKKLTVYTPVKDVYIMSGDMRLKVGEKFQLSAVVQPDDSSNKNIEWESSDINIASIDVNGNITALKEGETNIKVTSQDGNKEKSIKLECTKNLLGTEIIMADNLKVIGNEITGINHLDTTVGTLKKQINTGYIVEIYNNKNELLEDNMNFGTGSKIVFKDNNTEIVDEYNILIYGDVNGDGKINSVDLLKLQRHILRLEPLDGLLLKAANVLKNGKNPSTVDMLKIQRHILKLEIVVQ